VLGQLVEAVDGVDLNTALSERITAPLALEATQFEIAGEPVAHGWEEEREQALEEAREKLGR